jgi:hypothetical protein
MYDTFSSVTERFQIPSDMCHVGTLAGCDHVTISDTLNHMSTLTQSIQVVKSKAARVALDLQLAYSCKISQLVAELDP